MNRIFPRASAFNQDIGNWVTEAPIDGDCRTLASSNYDYCTIPNWDTSMVLDMASAFSQRKNFNGNTSAWNTASVTNMNRIFPRASAFNQDIGNWVTALVTNLS